jgi:hypothetical protein
MKSYCMFGKINYNLKTHKHTKMKKIYLFASLAIGFTLSAQQTKQATELSSIVKPQNIEASISTPTTTAFIPASFANTSCTITVYGAGTTSVTGGYVSGNNRFGDKEKAMRYSLSDKSLMLPATVSQVSLFVGVKKAGGPGTGVITVKVYADNAGAPGALLGTSATKTISALTAGSYTANIFTFTTPVSLTTNAFFVSADFSGAGQDTLGLAQSADGCASTSTLTAWDKDNANAWGTIKAGWNNLITDFGIFPIVTAEQLDVNVKELSKGDLTLSSAFPNPAKDEVNINFELKQSGNVEIALFDVTGKLVNTLQLTNLQAGSQSSKMDISALNAGIYMYSIKSNNAQLFSKFAVVK